MERSRYQKIEDIIMSKASTNIEIGDPCPKHYSPIEILTLNLALHGPLVRRIIRDRVDASQAEKHVKLPPVINEPGATIIQTNLTHLSYATS